MTNLQKVWEYLLQTSTTTSQIISGAYKFIFFIPCSQMARWNTAILQFQKALSQPSPADAS